MLQGAASEGGGAVVSYDRDYRAYGHLLTRALKKWRPELRLQPKDFRNTLQTHATENAVTEGWNTLLVDRHVGHAARTVAERHYFADINKRMVTLFAEQVVAKIDNLIEGLIGPENGEPDPAKWQKKARIVEIAVWVRERKRAEKALFFRGFKAIPALRC